MTRTRHARTLFVLAIAVMATACSGTSGPAAAGVVDRSIVPFDGHDGGAGAADTLSTTIAAMAAEGALDVPTLQELASGAGIGDAALLTVLRSLDAVAGISVEERRRLGTAIALLSEQLAFAPGSDPFAGLVDESTAAAIRRNLSDLALTADG